MRVLVGLCCFLFAGALALAQTDKSTIRGTVTDPSGAVVQGAVISLTELSTNIVAREVASDANGNYEVPDLKPSTYRIKVDHPGFKSYVADAVLLDTSQIRRIDISLQVGATTETVTVTAGAQLVTTDTGTISGGIDKRQFADTPLIDVYPSPLAVLTTVPGIQGAGWEIVVSGQRRTQLSQAMDGIENDRTGEQTNNMNFFEEVQVVTVNSSAENSRVASYNMTSKRGASQWHGMVYYKHFNSALNARLFFDVRKTPFIQHEWQGELGGPIIKDKTFVYGSWFAQKIPLGFFKRASVPTLQMRRGDFTQQPNRIVRDPLSGVPFPNNTIPASRISAVSQKTQELYIPEPNLGGPNELTNNYGWTHPFHYDFYKGNWPFIRVDHNFSSRNQFYARWTQRKTPYVLDSGLPKFIWTRLRDHRQTSVSDTHLFSATVVNTFRFGWNSNWIVDGDTQAGVAPLFGDSAVQAIGLQGVKRGNYKAQGFPRMIVAGITTLSTTAGGIVADDNDFSFEESLTWASGRHVWKFGGEYKTFKNFNGNIPLGTYGDFNFDGSLSGLGYADFLLGLPRSSTRLDPFTNRTRTNKEFGVFIADTFKPTAKLTLDYGLRWDYYALPTYTDGLMFNWDPASGNVIIPQAAQGKIHPLYPRTITIVNGEVVPKADKKNFRPRFAAAYRLKDGFVLRGGYGAFTERIDYFARILGGGPFQISENYTNVITNGVPFFSFPNPFPSSLAAAAVPSQSITGFPMQTDNGTIHQYNFSIEREVKEIGFRISYIGSRGMGLNYNVGINKPPASNIPFTTARRPYPQFVGATVARSDGASHYDSLQLQAQKRVGQFTFNAHWTWSNNMANFYITEDPYNVTNRWAREPITRRHYALFQTVWNMPFGRGKRFLADAPAVVDKVLGGWTLQHISYFATGGYFSPAFSGSDPSNTNTFGGLPDRVADGNKSGGQRTKEQWFDPAAFRVPPAGRYGNSGANILVGQGINVHHLSLAKKFALTERLSTTFTGAISNLFNHPHFNNPLSNISNPNPGRFTSVVADYNPEKQTSRHVSLKLRVEW
jgi:hypothetical protein